MRHQENLDFLELVCDAFSEKMIFYKPHPMESLSWYSSNIKLEIIDELIECLELPSKLISPFSRIVVDSGSTTAHLLTYLQTIEGLVVMTNSLPIATALTQKSNNATVLMSGGTWDPLSQSFQGQMSEKMIASYNFEMAFVGASGLDLVKGTTTFHELTKLSQVMSDSSEQTIVLAQSDKLFKKMPNIELSWGKISTLVTDNLLNDDAQRHIQNYGVQVICTPPMEK